MASSKNKVIFRADGNLKAGMGHIVRCISLMQILNGRFDCMLLVNNVDYQLLKFITAYVPVRDLGAQSNEEELSAMRTLVSGNDILVLDGYNFSENYQYKVKGFIKKLVIIDDLADKKLFADVIINHGDISVLPHYDTLPQANIFSGFDYLIARPEFLISAKRKKQIDKIDTVFICMGGADPFNITCKVLKACFNCDFVKEIIIVTGSVYPFKKELQSLISSSASMEIKHLEEANATQITQAIGRSQIAISTASSVSLEICCVKAGLICGTVADNQYSIHSLLMKNKCGVSIGNWITANVEQIRAKLESLKFRESVQAIVDAQTHCVDGKSDERLNEVFKGLVA
jgi:UDP-2,4-diacetamido-2,4,6-trideoxy-beta-L-altropyranose hydrolase